MAGNARQTAVDHQANAVDGERGFRDVRGNDDFTPLIASHSRILIIRRQLAVQWQHEELVAERSPRRLDGARDFIGAGHENEGVALGVYSDQALKFPDGKVP